MRQYDTVRLILTTHLNNYDIASATQVAESTVRRYRKLAAEKSLTWDALKDCDFDAFHRVFNKPSPRRKSELLPNLAELDAELLRFRMPLQVWWEDQKSEYPATTPSYSYLSAELRRYRDSQPTVMRQTHIPGERVFVDNSGKLAYYMDRETGERVAAQIFIGVLGGSSLLFVTATATQQTHDFILSHVRMFDYFGGVSEILVPDNLKASHTQAYKDMAKHYGAVALHARPWRPKDKAKAEAGVKYAQQQILSRLNRETFHSLEEINDAIAGLLEQANNRPMTRGEPSRRARFEEVERAALRPLPAAPFEYADWMTIKAVAPDYHVPVQGHFYSVPHALVGKSVDVRVSADQITVVHQRKTVATHVRSNDVGGSTTLPDHQTVAHRAQSTRTPDMLKEWAQEAGPNIVRFVTDQFAQERRMLGWKPSETVKSLAGAHGAEAVDRAISWAYEQGTPNISAIKRVLANAERRQRDVVRSKLDLSARALRENRHD